MSEMTNGIKSKLSRTGENVDPNLKTLSISTLKEWRICNVPRTAKNMKLKLSGNVWGLLNPVKRHYLHPGCQRGVFAIFHKRLMVLSLKIQGLVGRERGGGAKGIKTLCGSRFKGVHRRSV